MDKVAVVIPAYNEQDDLEQSVRILYDFLQSNGLQGYDIIIADNNSTDSTPDIAQKLVEEDMAKYHFVQIQGKGAAIKETWLSPKYDDYDYYAFMDADLATDLNALPRLIEGLRQGKGHNYGLAIGSRYIEGAQIERDPFRLFVSRTYRLLFSLLGTKVKDPQCGFKAVTKEVRDNVVTKIKNNAFIFDTELIYSTQKAGYNVKEIPVYWEERQGSTVNLKRDVPKFLYGLAGLLYERLTSKQ